VLSSSWIGDIGTATYTFMQIHNLLMIHMPYYIEQVHICYVSLPVMWD
jgi:hypothetical protein